MAKETDFGKASSITGAASFNQRCPSDNLFTERTSESF
jgi:hypothetical protein